MLSSTVVQNCSSVFFLFNTGSTGDGLLFVSLAEAVVVNVVKSWIKFPKIYVFFTVRPGLLKWSLNILQISNCVNEPQFESLANASLDFFSKR